MKIPYYASIHSFDNILPTTELGGDYAANTRCHGVAPQSDGPRSWHLFREQLPLCPVSTSLQGFPTSSLHREDTGSRATHDCLLPAQLGGVPRVSINAIKLRL